MLGIEWQLFLAVGIGAEVEEGWKCLEEEMGFMCGGRGRWWWLGWHRVGVGLEWRMVKRWFSAYGRLIVSNGIGMKEGLRPGGFGG